MQTHVGWSGELPSGSWGKLDVTVDENDLPGIFFDVVQGYYVPEMSTRLRFLIMHKTAELLHQAQLLSLGFNTPGVKERYQDALKARNKAVEEALDNELQ